MGLEAEKEVFQLHTQVKLKVPGGSHVQTQTSFRAGHCLSPSLLVLVVAFISRTNVMVTHKNLLTN